MSSFIYASSAMTFFMISITLFYDPFFMSLRNDTDFFYLSLAHRPRIQIFWGSPKTRVMATDQLKLGSGRQRRGLCQQSVRFLAALVGEPPGALQRFARPPTASWLQGLSALTPASRLRRSPDTRRGAPRLRPRTLRLAHKCSPECFAMASVYIDRLFAFPRCEL